ncbi:MAG: DUF924 family protein [Pseudomonadota bacterium]
MARVCSADEVLSFWFEESGPKHWFKKSERFDQICRERFFATHEAAAHGECWEWRTTPAGRCAEIIVLDQFSRNLHRDSARAFATDLMALVLAQEVVLGEYDRSMTDDQRYFCYMPYMHSESLVLQAESVRLFTVLGREEALRYAHAHRHVIERFGRYPHRNEILGRISTEEEAEYLKTNPGF